ncbi:MAG: substrate-binding domain-containing protein, partial [Planctomycetota bacterium]
EEAGFACDVWLGGALRSEQASWEAEQQSISEWLRGLTKPVGIMTCHDDRGLQVLDACRRAGLQAPDEVAVVSVDNDTHLCNLSTPPLTSIDVNPGRIGYEAAALLHRAMKGEEVSTEPTFLGPPRGIVVRQSTETSCVDDPDVAAAVRLIRDQAIKGLRVQEIIAATSHSPSTLERRFKRTFGRTLKEEINRVRLNRAKLLLAETDLPISEVAVRSGFGESKYFCEVFRRREGATATQYRSKFRLEN